MRRSVSFSSWDAPGGREKSGCPVAKERAGGTVTFSLNPPIASWGYPPTKGGAGFRTQTQFFLTEGTGSVCFNRRDRIRHWGCTALGLHVVAVRGEWGGEMEEVEEGGRGGEGGKMWEEGDGK